MKKLVLSFIIFLSSFCFLQAKEIMFFDNSTVDEFNLLIKESDEGDICCCQETKDGILFFFEEGLLAKLYKIPLESVKNKFDYYWECCQCGWLTEVDYDQYCQNGFELPDNIQETQCTHKCCRNCKLIQVYKGRKSTDYYNVGVK